uniref:Ribosomal RNA-processing protein 43 n=1 Tax=Eptatretus burgeri TaxID=7764 RepID=A0A8C4QB90_EPTBU
DVIVCRAAEPVAYYRRFLKENCRPDGRELGEVRITTLNIGSITSADGSALVKIGNTTVVCGVKGVIPNVDLSPLCSARFRPGPPCEQAQVAGQFLADVITSSELVSLEDLCIQKGKLVWVLYCDLECLDYDGNVLDACSIALLAALRNGQWESGQEGDYAPGVVNKHSMIFELPTVVSTSFNAFRINS